jgi:V8-like Glu-specific endopeptidase
MAVACGTASQPPPEKVACASAGIIAGTAAEDRALDAVGALEVLGGDGYRVFCTATLVAPTIVLTAKHCALTSDGKSLPTQRDVFFAIGGDPASPRYRVQALATAVSPPDSGGVAELGSDVGVYRLATSVQGVDPLRISTRNAAEIVGTALSLYGFGTDLPSCPEGTPYPTMRRVGVETLEAVDGNVFDLMYGGWAAYVSAQAQLGNVNEALVADRYENGVLLGGYEAWLKAVAPSSAQTCYGDSGGPAVLGQGASREVVGVTSWGWMSASSLCDGGTVIALFGPRTRSFMARMLGDAPDASP